MLKRRRKVVISLHGINTDGAWQKDVAPIISEQGWVYYPLYYQFIKRAAEAIRDGQVFPIVQPRREGEKPSPPPAPIEAKGLIVAIPNTPGGARKGAIMDFSKKLGLRDVNIGNPPRTLKYRDDGWLYDVPTILQTLSLLDHRQDDELGPAIMEFRRMIEKILDGPHSDARDLVKTEAMANLTV